MVCLSWFGQFHQMLEAMWFMEYSDLALGFKNMDAHTHLYNAFNPLEAWNGREK